MPDGRPVVIGRDVAFAVAALAVAAGCAAPRPALEAPRDTPDPISAPLTASEIESAASLLRLEDRREFNALVFGVASRAFSPSTRRQAVLAAGRIGGPAASTYVRAMLADPDTAVAASAAFMLGRLRETSAVAALADFVDPDAAAAAPTVAAEAATALGELATPDSRETLVRFLLEADTAAGVLQPAVRRALLAAADAGESPDHLIRWIGSSDAGIRWRAALGLSSRPGAASAEALVDLLADSDPTVRSTAIGAFTADGPAVAAIGVEAAIEKLLEAADDPAYAVRTEALRALTTYDDSAAERMLLERLDAAASHETVTILQSLAGGGRGRGGLLVPVIRAMAEDRATAEYIREIAVEAVGALDPDGSASWVASFAADPSWRVRSGVARVIGRRRDDHVRVLEILARDPDPRVAAAALDAAVIAIGSRTPARLRPLLLEAVQHHDVKVRAAALRGFTLIDDPTTFPILLDAYDRARYDTDPDAAVSAIDAIADLATRGAIVADRAFFTRFEAPADHHVRRKAIERFGERALGAWGPVRPLETFTADARYRRFVEDWLAPPPDRRRLPVVRIWTDAGTIDAILFGDLAPLTVANFLALADAGFFDGHEWARVIPNFVVQGGDPRGDTSGGPGYTIRDEPNRARFEAGSLAMARSRPDTGGSQFFITYSPQPRLNGDYTVFGRVLAGLDVLESILPGDRILAIQAILGE